MDMERIGFKLDVDKAIEFSSNISREMKEIEIASWSPSGSRVISHYEHVLDYGLLKKLKESRELKKFLVVNKQSSKS